MEYFGLLARLLIPAELMGFCTTSERKSHVSDHSPGAVISLHGSGLGGWGGGQEEVGWLVVPATVRRKKKWDKKLEKWILPAVHGSLSHAPFKKIMPRSTDI